MEFHLLEDVVDLDGFLLGSFDTGEDSVERCCVMEPVPVSQNSDL